MRFISKRRTGHPENAGILRTGKIYVYYVILAALFSQKIFCSQWINISSSQIEMLTDNNEADAQAALRVFQDARQFFLSGSAFPVTLNHPIRIFAFQSQEEYAPYRLNSNAFGHFLHSAKCDYIVLEDIKPEHYEAALHEYTHYAIRQAGLNLPTWLNEGLADLYSSLEPNGQTTLVGRALPVRTALLANTPLLELKTLLAVTPDSSFYQEGSKLPLFYAQSWALAHMLVLDSRYAAGFPSFLQSISSGVPSAEAFYQVYRKSPEQIESDLRQYYPRMTGNRKSFQVKLGEPSLRTPARTLSNEQEALELADLLAAHPTTAHKALRMLADLAQQTPGNPLLEERMGQAAWNMSRVEEARAYFAQAVEHGSHDADTIYRYAMLQKQAGAPDEVVMRLFEQTIELAPDFDEARLRLGLLQFNRKNFRDAAHSLSRLTAVKEEWAYVYCLVMAYCAIEFNRPDEAAVFGQKAKAGAKTLSEHSQVDALLLYLQARTPTTRPESVLASAQHAGTAGGGGNTKAF